MSDYYYDDDELVSHMERMLAFAKKKGGKRYADKVKGTKSVSKRKIRPRMGQETPLCGVNQGEAPTRPKA
jgi:hypothetical protein